MVGGAVTDWLLLQGQKGQPGIVGVKGSKGLRVSPSVAMTVNVIFDNSFNSAFLVCLLHIMDDHQGRRGYNGEQGYIGVRGEQARIQAILYSLRFSSSFCYAGESWKTRLRWTGWLPRISSM